MLTLWMRQPCAMIRLRSIGKIDPETNAKVPSMCYLFCS